MMKAKRETIVEGDRDRRLRKMTMDVKPNPELPVLFQIPLASLARIFLVIN